MVTLQINKIKDKDIHDIAFYAAKCLKNRVLIEYHITFNGTGQFDRSRHLKTFSINNKQYIKGTV